MRIYYREIHIARREKTAFVLDRQKIELFSVCWHLHQWMTNDETILFYNLNSYYELLVGDLCGSWLKTDFFEPFSHFLPYGCRRNMASQQQTDFSASDVLNIRKGDYVSPGLKVIVPDACFPRMKEGDISYVIFRRTPADPAFQLSS